MMDTVETIDIAMPDKPITVNLGKWIIEHPECDSICERIGSGPDYLIYAYALSKEGNAQLQALRDEKFVGKKILMGITMNGLRRIA
ncbi:MAG: hypothetical protein IJT96_12020 [Lachnospiraceae bacterium]|nr:hypothetical protein [Lachnospiraceae bacterium]